MTASLRQICIMMRCEAQAAFLRGLRKEANMDTKRLVLTAICILTLACMPVSHDYTAYADESVQQSEETVMCSAAGGQVLDTGDKYYIAISELPACADGTVLVYDKSTGETSKLATASNINQMVHLNGAIYALAEVKDGTCLIRITDTCVALTTAPVIDQLSVYGSRLYFLADGHLTTIASDGSDMRTLSTLNMGQYVIVDNTVYFTNMDDAKTYTVNSKLQGQALSITAGCLYSLNLTSGVQAKQLSDGVKSLKTYGGDIYLQNMGESYVMTIGDTEQPTGRLCKFDPTQRNLERQNVQNEYSYFPTSSGLIVHSDYELALYSSNVYTMSLYTPESGSSVYYADDSGVMVYEPTAQRLTYVSADLNKDNFVVYSGTGTPDQVYTRPTLSPASTTQTSSEAVVTPAPAITPVPTETASTAPTEGVIFTDSATRRLTENEIRSLRDNQLIYARYEILARNGYVFNTEKYLEYYRQFSWYHENPDFKFGDLDEIESYNYELIRAIMNEIFATPTPKPTEQPTENPTPTQTAKPSKSSTNFIFPDSSNEKLTRAQVLSIEANKLLEARYEILARNGYVFKNASWQSYYDAKSWYTRDESFAFGDMNSIESYNYELIRSIDKEINGEVTVSTPSPQYEFIFPDAMTRKLTRKEVLAIDKDQLLKARYEILARAGYVFETKEWREYFEDQDWYEPDEDFGFYDMNEIESYNYELIREIDKEG